MVDSHWSSGSTGRGTVTSCVGSAPTRLSPTSMKSPCEPGTDGCRSFPMHCRPSAWPPTSTARQPAVFFDFDGTLSDIVDDPDSARPAAGAARHCRSWLRIVRSRCCRPRPRRCDRACRPARYLVCGQPWFRADRTRRNAPPKRRRGGGHSGAGAGRRPAARPARVDSRCHGGAQAIWCGRALPQRRQRSRWRGGSGGARSGPAPRASRDHRPRSHRAASGYRLGQGKNTSLGDRSLARCRLGPARLP